MKVVLKLFATLQDYLPAEARRTSTAHIEIADDTRVADLIRQYQIPEALCHLVLIDGVYLPAERWASQVLHEGETLAIWPPVAGG